MDERRIPVVVQQYEGQDALHWLITTGDAPSRLETACKPGSYSVSLRAHGVTLRSVSPIRFVCQECQRLYDAWHASLSWPSMGGLFRDER